MKVVNAPSASIHRRLHRHGRDTLDCPSVRARRGQDVQLLWDVSEMLAGMTSPV